MFDAYTPEIMHCRKSGIITGLPDAYGRGRIIGDYRRVALYGVDRLIEAKREERAQVDDMWPTDEVIRVREELAEQIRALETWPRWRSATAATSPARPNDAQEAVQWTYLAYLGAIKEANGAAMSIGRISTFLDIYIERDLQRGRAGRERRAGADRTSSCRSCASCASCARPTTTRCSAAIRTGRPNASAAWISNGRPLVTKHQLPHAAHADQSRAGAGAEHHRALVEAPAGCFKRYCIKVSRDTSSLQYENDDLMRPYWGDDYGIACCVSAMRLGKQMQFFGARVNLAKALLYAINGGRDEISGDQVAPATPPVTGDVLDYDEVFAKFDAIDGVARAHLRARDELHPLHARQVLLRAPRDGAARPRHPAHHGVRHRRPVGGRRQPFGDQVRQGPRHPRRDRPRRRLPHRERRATFPQFGNNDDRVDDIAADLVSRFMKKIRKHPTYRNAMHTQCVLTITSNVVYGKHTGNTPDGRRKGEPFAPGANPMHGRDSHGWLASCLSVARLPYADAQDGISYTVSVAPQKAHLSRRASCIDNAVKAFDMYFGQGGFHMNLNVLSTRRRSRTRWSIRTNIRSSPSGSPATR